MIRPALLSLVVAMAPFPAMSQDTTELEGMLDLGIEALNSEGANITIGKKSVEAGNVLLLEDIRMEPEDETPAELTIDWVRIAPLADDPGSIRITMAEVARLETVLDGMDAPTVFLFENDGLEVTTNLVLGAVGKATGSITAEQLSLRSGNAEHPIIRHLDMTISDLMAQFSADEAAGSGAGNFSISGLTAAYDISDPLGARMVMRSDNQAVDIAFSGTNLQAGELELDEFIAGGGSLKMTLSSGPSATSLTSESAQMPLSIDAEAGSSALDIAIGADGIDFGWSIGSILYDVVLSEAAPLPIPPFEVSLGSSEMRMTMPVLPEENARPAVMKFSLADLLVGEGLWQLIDPGQTIQRDPLNIDIDLSWMVKLFIPLDETEDGVSPLALGEFGEIRITALNASGGGASITTNGAVDLDYAAGVPMPEGQISVAIKGVQTLSQALVNLGLIEQMQAGMVMGGIMAFSKPGDEPDSFTSVIEFRDGQVLANGAPLPIQ